MESFSLKSISLSELNKVHDNFLNTSMDNFGSNHLVFYSFGKVLVVSMLVLDQTDQN